MPRTSRKISRTDIYHVVLRGINQQIIFEETEDYEHFKKLLLFCSPLYGCRIFSYCLMNNHVHMLIHISSTQLELFFKSLEVRYANWFNTKYQRSGHLFQNRFYSTPIESREALLNVFRYIHYNPVKAGITKNAAHYVWSSCAAYFSHVDDELVSIDDFLALAGLPSDTDPGFFCTADESFQSENVLTSPHGITDEKGIELLQSVCGLISHSDFQKLPKEERNRNLKLLHRKGLSVRQLVRICGVSKSTVERALGMKK